MPSKPLESAAFYWDSAAETYEADFSGTVVGRFRRDVVWEVLCRSFAPGQRVLELSCGTGIDAVELGSRGIGVIACDLSPRMIELAREHAGKVAPRIAPDFRVLATEHISSLRNEPAFDGAFSNFSGLNCVEDLGAVARDLADLLKPGASLVVCMMGRFVPLEIAWFLAHGRVKRAFRRLMNLPNPASCGVLTVKRPTVAQIRKSMQLEFRLVRWKGIGVVVPPSYAEGFAVRRPRLIRLLIALDKRLAALPLFRSMADCVLLEFERVSTNPLR